MLSNGLAKVCLIVAVVQVLLRENSVSSSSIYVGRHAAATASEHGNSASVISEVNTCEDSDKRLCRKIIHFYGNQVCSTQKKILLDTVQSVCQSTCGFCTNYECEDLIEIDLCTEFQSYCDSEEELGNLVKEFCPKTCKSCHLRPSKGVNNLVVIGG